MERKAFDAELMKQRPALRRASLGEELRCLLAGFTAAVFPQPVNDIDDTLEPIFRLPALTMKGQTVCCLQSVNEGPHCLIPIVRALE